MKKICALTIFLLTISCSVLASVRSVTEDYQGNYIKYPLVKLAKSSIANKINKDIEHSKENLKKQHSSMLGAADKISMSFKLIYENKDRLNFLLYSYTYNNGAAHGQYYTEGFSYDLHTGKKATPETILGKIEPELLDKGVRSGRFTLTDGANKPRKLTDFWKVEAISSECLINKDGSFTLIYQPYDLAPYAYGNTFITIPAEELPYLTGKHLNLESHEQENNHLSKKQLAAEEKLQKNASKQQLKREEKLAKEQEKLVHQQEKLQEKEIKKQQKLMTKQSKAYEKQTLAEAKEQEKQAKLQQKKNKKNYAPRIKKQKHKSSKTN